jgi:pantoate--beta-alanine ligase
MKVITAISDFRQYRAGLTGAVGFVPTMGFLHAGHLSLIRQCKRECARTIASIFVNPTQFGPNEDFDRYPRDFERDRRLLEGEGVDCVFCPEVKEMYRGGDLTMVKVSGLTEKLCGRSRPTHFQGVTTVVAKLFNIVQPQLSYFGQKDLQQSVVIRRMAADLNIPVEIKVCPIFRESDGLALSSRNSYLSAAERTVAPVLYQSLRAAERLYQAGERSAENIRAEILKLIQSRVTEDIGRIDYVEIVETDLLDSVAVVQHGNAVMLALFIGKTRLIDNLIF